MKQIIIFLLFTILFTAKGRQLPSFIQKCKRNVPELDECMKNSLLDFRERLRKDIKQLKLRSLEPYFLPQASLKTSWMNASLSNLRLYGGSNYDVEYFKMDLEEDIIWLNLTVPYLNIKSHYVVDGRLAQIVLHGEGELEIKQNNTASQIKLYGNKMMKNDKEYLNLKYIDYKLTNYTITYMYLQNLFQNNMEFTERINRIIADNLNEFATDVIPLAEKIVSSICLSMFKKVFDTFSLNELFD